MIAEKTVKKLCLMNWWCCFPYKQSRCPFQSRTFSSGVVTETNRMIMPQTSKKKRSSKKTVIRCAKASFMERLGGKNKTVLFNGESPKRAGAILSRKKNGKITYAKMIFVPKKAKVKYVGEFFSTSDLLCQY